MSEPFLGEIRIFGFNFAPSGWAQCNGQLLSIFQNTALFSLLGTQYGGDGETTFALPELRGRTPMHVGSGPGLSNRPIGQRSGNETTTLNGTNLPPHSHTTKVTSDIGNETSPVGNAPATANDGESNYASGSMVVDGPATSSVGGGASFGNLPPYLVLNFCIAMVGVYPSQ